MDYETLHPIPCNDVAEQNIVAVSYCDDGEYQAQGFECENVYLMSENISIYDLAIIDDLDNYDGMDYPSITQLNAGRRQRRWKRLLRSMLPNRRRQENPAVSSKRQQRDIKEAFDPSTVTVLRSNSLDPRSNTAKEVPMATSTAKLERERVKALDPRILDFVSRILYASKKVGISRPHQADPSGETGREALSDDSTACTEQSDVSTDSQRSDKSLVVPSLMEQRLLATGLVKRDDFEFVPDYVSKEVLHLVEDLKKRNKHHHVSNDGNVSHVKTGIWEIVCFDENGQPKEPEYIVTGVSMDDRVDTKKLRKFVFAGEQQNKRRPKLAMAPTEIAEGLAGYKSGTMAPICHGQNMKLFLEESLIKDVDLRTHRMNVGSGMFGKCLSISAHQFLEIAKANPEGVTICPIIRRTTASKS